MKKYKKIMAITYAIIFVLLIVGVSARSVKREMRSDIDIANETRIYDEADLFTSDEEAKLDKKLRNVVKSEKTDVIIATTNNTNGKTAQEYAEEFYTQHGFGYDKQKGTGVLLLIDMDTTVTGKRKIWISGCGDAKKSIDNNVATDISNDIKNLCSKGKYYLAANNFLSEAKSYMNTPASIPGLMRSSGALFLIALIGTGVFVFFKVKTFGMKVTSNASTYLDKHSVRTNSRRDTFLGTTVTTRTIEHNNNSGGGSDSGGSSGSDFSGGGADF